MLELGQNSNEDISEDKINLSSTYKNYRELSKSSQMDTSNRSSSYVNFRKQSRSKIMNKSSNKTINELLAGDDEFSQQTGKLLSINNTRILKNQLVKRLVEVMDSHILQTKSDTIHTLCQFDGFLRESSDDSLVKLDCRFKNFKQEYSKRIKGTKKKKSRQNESFIPERATSPMIMKSKFGKSDNDSNFNEAEEASYNKAMKEYLDTRKSMEITDVSIKVKKAKIRKKKSPKTVKYPTSVSPEVIQRSQSNVFTST